MGERVSFILSINFSSYSELVDGLSATHEDTFGNLSIERLVLNQDQHVVVSPRVVVKYNVSWRSYLRFLKIRCIRAIAFTLFLRISSLSLFFSSAPSY